MLLNAWFSSVFQEIHHILKFAHDNPIPMVNVYTLRQLNPQAQIVENLLGHFTKQKATVDGLQKQVQVGEMASEYMSTIVACLWSHSC